MDILQEAAKAWKELTQYRYNFTYGYKKELHSIHLTFSLEDFPHLAGFQYLEDISLPNYNSSKIVDRILEKKITFEQIKKSSNYINMVQPRLFALIQLKHSLDNDFNLYSFFPKMYPFTTQIKADYLISSHVNISSFVFIIKNSILDNSEYDFVCCSIFEQGERNYESNQRLRTILKKERLHIPTNTYTILSDKLSQKK